MAAGIHVDPTLQMKDDVKYFEIGGLDSNRLFSDVEDPDYCSPTEQDQPDTEESSHESSQNENECVSRQMGC